MIRFISLLLLFGFSKSYSSINIDSEIFATEAIRGTNYVALLSASKVTVVDVEQNSIVSASEHDFKITKHDLEGRIVLAQLFIPPGLLLCLNRTGDNCELYKRTKGGQLSSPIRKFSVKAKVPSFRFLRYLPVVVSPAEIDSTFLAFTYHAEERWGMQSFSDVIRMWLHNESSVIHTSQDEYVKHSTAPFDWVKNIYGFEHNNFVYFVRNVYRETTIIEYPEKRRWIIRLSRICSNDTNPVLGSITSIMLECGEGCTANSAHFDPKSGILAISVEHDENSIVPSKASIIFYHIDRLATELTHIWTYCQNRPMNITNDRCRASDMDWCFFVSRKMARRCEKYGFYHETWTLCDMQSGGAKYIQLESFRPMHPHFDYSLPDGFDVKEFFIDPSFITDGVAVLYLRLADHTLQRLLVWNATCEGLYTSCDQVLPSMDPMGCGWCVGRNGLGGYSAVSENCHSPNVLLRNSCPPRIKSVSVDADNKSIIIVHGSGMKALASVALTVCGDRPCHVTDRLDNMIRCSLPGAYDDCTVKVAGLLESHPFHFNLRLNAVASKLPRDGASNTPITVALVAAGLLIVALGVIGGFLWCRCRRKWKDADDGGSSIAPLPVDRPDFWNRGLGGNRYDVSPQEQTVEMVPPYEDLRFLVPENLRIPLASLVLACEVGEGHFGKVYKALYSNSQGKTSVVAVKTLRAGIRGVREFLQEGIRMENFEHERVLSLVGISFSEQHYPMIVTPFMPRGDLLTYLRQPSNTPKLRQLLNFCVEIAEGMQYLHKLKFIHRDLAARNCMLDARLKATIADFGLCRDVYESGSYEARHQDRDLPLRWMSLEGIERLQYTCKGDVWAYGIVLWEVMTRGDVPYSDIHSYRLLSYLKSGGRLQKPQYCPQQLYTIMCECWQAEAELRPDFRDLCTSVPAVIRHMEAAATPTEETGGQLNPSYMNCTHSDSGTPDADRTTGVVV